MRPYDFAHIVDTCADPIRRNTSGRIISGMYGACSEHKLEARNGWTSRRSVGNWDAPDPRLMRCVYVTFDVASRLSLSTFSRSQ